MRSSRFSIGSPGPRATAKVAAPIVAIGSAIDSVCGKCKRVTSHRVTRKVGVQPTLLECSECAEQHAYKSPAASAEAKKRRDLKAAIAATPEEVWTRAMKRSAGPAIAYSMAGHFPIGQRLTHAEFGDGVVTSRASGTVCTVIFQGGERRLLMGATNRLPEGTF